MLVCGRGRQGRGLVGTFALVGAFGLAGCAVKPGSGSDPHGGIEPVAGPPAGPTTPGCTERVEIPFTGNADCTTSWSEGVTTCSRDATLEATWSGTMDWQGFGIPLRAGWSGVLDLTKLRDCALVFRASGALDEIHVIVKGRQCAGAPGCNQSSGVPLAPHRTQTGEVRIPITAFETGTLPMFAAEQIMFGTWKRERPASMTIEFPLSIE